MPSRYQELQTNMYYHIYNRGYGKKTIFFDKYDFERFMKTIIRYSKDFPGIKLTSYCFLGNHFHLILRSLNSGKEISDFMRKIQQGYAMYFKSKYISSPDSIGPVFEGRFKAKRIDTEEYLHQCIAYVNYNPLKHEIVTDIKDYPYTSYHQLVDKEKFKGVPVPDLDELEF